MKRSTGRPRHSGADGQSTVEFALLLPLVVAMAAGVVQVAIVARDQLMVVHAAREAARVASVDRVAEHARAAARRVAPGAQVDIGPRPAIGEPITVRLHERVPTRVPLIGALLPDVTLTATAVMAVER